MAKGIKLKYLVKGVADSTKNAVAKADLSNVVGKIQETGGAALEAAKKVKLPEVDVSKMKRPFDKKETPKEVEAKEETPLIITAISTHNAIKIIYYLMAVDGQIFHREEEKFDAIGAELDPNFKDNKDEIIKECQARLDTVVNPEDYYNILQDGVEEALVSSKQTADTFITPKLLIWDLLTIAYSDESYDEAEKSLLRFIVEKTNIDKAVFLEMESSILTLMDIEKELNWIKTTNRPYLTIEAMVNELADRKNVIFESVKDLISL